MSAGGTRGEIFHLVVIDETGSDDPFHRLEIDADWWRLRDGLILLHSAADRSAVYHAVKRTLPDGAPLLVAPLADAPKFKGMEEGSLAWIRDRSH